MSNPDEMGIQRPVRERKGVSYLQKVDTSEQQYMKR